MSTQTIPQTDSIEELARFWDSRDITDFEDELAEVTEPVFVTGETATVQIHLRQPEWERLMRLARDEGVEQARLVEQWVAERLAA